MGDPAEGLFRQEVVATKRDRLFGEVVLTHTRPTAILVGGLALFGVAGGAWLVTGTYARTEAAPGILLTSAASIKVIPPVSGIVSDLRAQEGIRIRKGEDLATISMDRQSDAGTSAAGAGVASVDTRISLVGRDVSAFERKFTSERGRLSAIAEAAQDEIEKIDDQISLQGELVDSSRVMYERIGTLVEKGYVSHVELERRHQILISAQQDLASLKRQRVALAAQITQSQAQQAVAQSEYEHESIGLAASVEALKQQRAQLAGERSYVIKAPTSGRISALQIAVGGSAQANTPLFTIVPEGTPLRAEAYVASRAIGFVRPGQEVRLLYDAFPYSRFGSFKGAVVAVSRTIIDPRESLLPVKVDEPVYRVIISLERQNVNAFGQSVPLQPGMALTANIVLERQTFIEWLLAPLRAVQNRS